MFIRRSLAALFAIAGTLCVASPGPGDDVSCKELNKLWADRYHADFGVRWKKEEFACPSGTAKTAQALHDLYLADEQHSFYLNARNRTVGTFYSAECDKDIVATMAPNGLLTICDRFYTVDPEKRSSTIFHESAHARDDDPKHVKCTHGDADGRVACDESLTDDYRTGSGYNWEVRYLRYVADNPKANDMTRWVSQGHLRILLTNRFNRISAGQLKAWSR